MMSSIAIDKKRVPENVIAIAIICPSLKQDKFEINLPKMTTSKKNAIMRATFIIIAICIARVMKILYLIFIRIFKFLALINKMHHFEILSFCDLIWSRLHPHIKQTCCPFPSFKASQASCYNSRSTPSFS